MKTLNTVFFLVLLFPFTIFAQDLLESKTNKELIFSAYNSTNPEAVKESFFLLGKRSLLINSEDRTSFYWEEGKVYTSDYAAKIISTLFLHLIRNNVDKDILYFRKKWDLVSKAILWDFENKDLASGICLSLIHSLSQELKTNKKTLSQYYTEHKY